MSSAGSRSNSPASSPAKVVDTTGDGIADTVLMDTTGDGVLDTAMPAQVIDTTGDFHADTVIVDTTGDGQYDTAVPLGRHTSAGSMQSSRRVHGQHGDLRMSAGAASARMSLSAESRQRSFRSRATDLQRDSDGQDGGSQLPRGGSSMMLGDTQRARSARSQKSATMPGTAPAVPLQAPDECPARSGLNTEGHFTRVLSTDSGESGAAGSGAPQEAVSRASVADRSRKGSVAAVSEPAVRRASRASSTAFSAPRQVGSMRSISSDHRRASEVGSVPPQRPIPSPPADDSADLRAKLELAEEEIRNLAAKTDSLDRLLQGHGESTDAKTRTLNEELRRRADRVRELEQIGEARLRRINELERELRSEEAYRIDREGAVVRAEDRAKRLQMHGIQLERTLQMAQQRPGGPIFDPQGGRTQQQQPPVYGHAAQQRLAQQTQLLGQAKACIVQLHEQVAGLQRELESRDAVEADLREKLAEAQGAIVANVDGIADLDSKLQQSRRALRWILNSQGQIVQASREPSPARPQSATSPAGSDRVGSPPWGWEPPPYAAQAGGAVSPGAVVAVPAAAQLSPPPPVAMPAPSGDCLDDLVSRGQHSVEAFRSRLSRLHDDVRAHTRMKGDWERSQRVYIEQVAEEVRRGAAELQREAELLSTTASPGRVRAAVPADASHPTLSVLRDVERMLAATPQMQLPAR
eukprot:TRINITY_DN2833_c3_g1_i1.p1 TRINITY_DN2833_c3_g1~~TRINITY_DN2833_c3_g1_i1.p1  ORF type:complete len:721 (+),score=241.10 TRINITY_DN2833_c3_g1_i1:82-2163(+)